VSRSNLTLDEARRRAGLIAEPEYEIHLDLSGEDRFRAETAIRFRSTEPGAETFLDCAGVEVVSADLNGHPIDAHDGLRVRLEGLADRNELRLVTQGPYSNTGKGLNRFVDPVDGTVYLHTDSEPFDAHRWYPCFDQPDIKGTFRFSATVPAGWEVVSNYGPEGAPVEEGDVARWTFRVTPPLPTYITAMVAGPFHAVREQHRDIDLGLFCRQSLAQHLDADEWLEITRQGLDWFEEAFGHPYPFERYDQVLVPEFAAGAMENPGCVTFHEHYIFRSRVTRTQRETRAGTILHEMAHMWFGDLVTMRWWDDLWLNESFASYMGVLSQSEATKFTEGWTVFANSEKIWALQQDQLPTTHPIVADIPDLLAVHLNFDGITYAKGASVLKQLVAWVGREQTLEAMKAYFARHAFGNTELSDFLRALEETSGRDLDAWSKEWLETAGVNTLRPEVSLDGGRYGAFAIRQEAPEAWPTLRSHRVAVGLYDDRDGRLVRRARAELDVTGERTEVGDLAGEPVAALALVNDDDLTFAKVRFDEGSLGTVLDRLGDIDGTLARAGCWTACWDMTRDAELPARRYAELVLRHGGKESEVGTLERALAQANAAVALYGDPANRDAAMDALAASALAQLDGAEAGSDHQLAWARGFIDAARSSDHLGTMRGLLDGSVSFEGLAVDIDLRWHAVTALATAGAEDAESLIAAELDRDPTDRGQRQAIAARAGRPSEEAKAEAWRTILEDRTMSEAMLGAAMRGFQQPGQEDLLAPYADRYFEALSRVWEERDLEYILEFGEQLYPKWVVSEATIEGTDRYLARDDVPGPIRRLLLEGRDRIVRAIRARAVDAAAAR
jgi:aminopeptidase N